MKSYWLWKSTCPCGYISYNKYPHEWMARIAARLHALISGHYWGDMTVGACGFGSEYYKKMNGSHYETKS